VAVVGLLPFGTLHAFAYSFTDQVRLASQPGIPCASQAAGSRPVKSAAAGHNYLLKDKAEKLCEERHSSITEQQPSVIRRHASEVVGEDGCGACHDPHGAVGTGSFLLRADAGEGSQHACLICHVEKKTVRLIGHAPKSLTAMRFDDAACHPCHWIHPDRGIEEAPWPRWLEGAAAQGPFTSDAPASNEVTAPRCTVCHRVGGQAPVPAISTHPDVLMFNLDQGRGPDYPPLFNDCGEEDRPGRFNRRTCHLTHGRQGPTTVAGRSSDDGPASQPAPVENDLAAQSTLRRLLRHLRAFSGLNLCTNCHGFDARRRFLYFHQPARRGGPLVLPAQPRWRSP
jgi:predicted CXXCH cytochrome family protein